MADNGHSGYECWYTVDKVPLDSDGEEIDRQRMTLETGRLRGKTLKDVYSGVAAIVVKYERAGGESLRDVPCWEIKGRLKKDTEFSTVIRCEETATILTEAVLTFSRDESSIWRRFIQIEGLTDNEEISDPSSSTG